MRLLLDECVARDIKNDLVGHEVHTVEDAGFKGLKNGEMLRTAANACEVLITVDQNLPFQQNVRSLPVAVIVVIAGGITYEKLRPLIPNVLEALRTIQPGELIVVEADV